jgi:hypothetical protein
LYKCHTVSTCRKTSAHHLAFSISQAPATRLFPDLHPPVVEDIPKLP